MPTLHNEKLSGRMSHAIYIYLAFDYWGWRWRLKLCHVCYIYFLVPSMIGLWLVCLEPLAFGEYGVMFE